MKHASKVNRQFLYTPSVATNIAKTIKAEQMRLKELAKSNVVEIKAKRKTA